METIQSEFNKLSMIISKGYGLDNLSAKLFSICFLEPSEISIEELAKRTGYSLASISNKMKFLESFGGVQRIKKPGSKKLFYYMEKDIFKTIKRQFKKAYTSEIVPAKEIVPQIIDKYKNKNLSKLDKEKLNIIIKYHNQILCVEKVFDNFLKELNELK